jgi:DNA-binding NarL/FixJ family response regulator
MEPSVFYGSAWETTVRRWRLILADDHKILREGLYRLLDRSEFEVVAQVEDGRSLVTAAANLKPDLIITDFTMPLLNGLEASKQILQHDPTIKILMLSMHQSANYPIDAWHAGLRGYVPKDADWRTLREGIRKVLNGQLCFEPSVTQPASRSADPRQRNGPNGGELTQRQREVLQMLAEGRVPKEIAGALGISVRTVEFHKYRIMETLGFRSVPQLAVYAVKTGIV